MRPGPLVKWDGTTDNAIAQQVVRDGLTRLQVVAGNISEGVAAGEEERGHGRLLASRLVGVFRDPISVGVKSSQVGSSGAQNRRYMYLAEGGCKYSVNTV